MREGAEETLGRDEARLQADVVAAGNIPAVKTILNVVCQITGMGFAAVARVTEARWIACDVKDDIAFGLKPGGELKVDTTICHEIRQSGEAVIIDSVATDIVFCSHPTPALYGFQSYISMPIILSDGAFFGTLCAIDPQPRSLKKAEIVGMFKLFAELIAFNLEAANRLSSAENSLRLERQDADLRELFIGVLGHDLRSPLSATASAVRMLTHEPLTERGQEIVAIVNGAVTRMATLIENVLDFARGRVGGGLVLNRTADQSLETVIEQILSEFRTSYPGRAITTKYQIAGTVSFDSGKLGQLVSNLVSNALTYGAASEPIEIEAHVAGETLQLKVRNRGEPISPKARGRLFEPFVRGNETDRKGLGLGLYIASEIARAHGGTLTVESTDEETCFTFRMPAPDAA